MEKYLHNTDTKTCVINFRIYKLPILLNIYCSYILHKKLNKIFQEPVGPILSF